MTAHNETERPVPGVAQQVSTRIAFFVIGIGMAAWAPLVPYARERMRLDEGALGILLLFLGAGSICTMPITGPLAARYGCRRVIATASVFIALTLPFLAIAQTNAGLATGLFVFGAALGAVDVAVNIQAIMVEKASGRSMMSGFHGLFSVGGILGAGGVSGLLSLGLGPLPSTLCITAVIISLTLRFANDLLGYGSEQREPLFVWPHGKVLFLGILCFIVFLVEGSMLDWSAVFLTTQRGMGQAQAGLGYAVFAVAMTVGRLTGDRVVQALGSTKVVLWGGLCAAAGFLLAVLAPGVPATLAGFILIGLGASNIVPVFFTAAGTQKPMPVGLAVSAITTIGYAGILAGPALIGFAARLSSLEMSFALLAALLVGVAASARAVTR